MMIGLQETFRSKWQVTRIISWQFEHLMLEEGKTLYWIWIGRSPLADSQKIKPATSATDLFRCLGKTRKAESKRIIQIAPL